VEARLQVEPRLGGRISWEGTTLVFQPADRWPEGSVVVVRLRSGARSQRGLPLLRSTSWSFQIGGPRFVYLWPSGSPAELQVRAIDRETPLALTDTAAGVTTFGMAADRTSLVYATRSEIGDRLLWLDLVTGEEVTAHTCPPRTACSTPALSPGEQWLAFQQSPLVEGPSGQAVEGPSQVWITELSGAASAPVGPPDHVHSQPHWTPQGWLAYYDHTLRAIAVIEAGSGNSEPFQYFPEELGELPSWSPDGAFLVFPVIDFPVETPESEDEDVPVFFSHLVRWNFETGESLDLSQGSAGQVEDASPAYSPDQEWIAFSRKHLDRGRWTLGRQLWLMRSDGSEPRALTHEPDYHHSAIDWNADSSALVYMRFNQAELSSAPEIWVYDLAREEARLLVIGGYLPRWVP
jgi:Tol biopolymer transport system component